jgi:beta-N-acetylhexosaminidase
MAKILLILLILAGAGTYSIYVLGKTQGDPARLIMSKMTLDEKIGQMIIIGFEGQTADTETQRLISDYNISGINLLGRNIKDPEQIKGLISGLQDISHFRLLIAADQEGGEVVRFKFLDEQTPESGIKDAAQAEAVAAERASELKNLGVNMIFAPVMDYVSATSSYLFSRTFETDPDKIAELGAAMIRGYLRGGIIPVAKHFPGYGNMDMDPHKNLAVNDIGNAELENNLLPFKMIVKNLAPAIMTAHIVVPSVDSKPATRSPMFLNGVLRDEFGFKGVIITDDLEMASAGASAEQAAVDAVTAGADMIIVSDLLKKQVSVFNRLKQAVQTGEISEQRINESVIRILNLKKLLS